MRRMLQLYYTPDIKLFSMLVPYYSGSPMKDRKEPSRARSNHHFRQGGQMALAKFLDCRLLAIGSATLRCKFLSHHFLGLHWGGRWGTTFCCVMASCNPDFRDVPGDSRKLRVEPPNIFIFPEIQQPHHRDGDGGGGGGGGGDGHGEPSHSRWDRGSWRRTATFG